MNVAFYGGSFNPPHVAHVLAATYLLAIGAAERVLMVPVYGHAFDKPLVDFRHRLRMAELATSFVEGVEVLSIEQELPSPNRTLVTLQTLSARHPDWRFRLVVGSDVLGETQKWHAFDAIIKIAPLFVLGRVGTPEGPVPVIPGVSSTHIRALLARRNDPDAKSELERFVPKRVLEYIDAHALYR